MDPVLDDLLTFNLTGVVDTGGIKRIDCFAKMQIPPAPINYEWMMTKPDGTVSNGPGPSASVVADQCGSYDAIIDVSSSRECPPPPRLFSTHYPVTQGRELFNGALSTDLLQLDLIESAVDAVPIVCGADFAVSAGGSYKRSKLCCGGGEITPALRHEATGSLAGTASVTWCMPSGMGDVGAALPGIGQGAVSWEWGPYVTTQIGGLEAGLSGTYIEPPCENGCAGLTYSVPFGFEVGVGVDIKVWIEVAYFGQVSAHGSVQVVGTVQAFTITGGNALWGSGCGGEPVQFTMAPVTVAIQFTVDLYRDDVLVTSNWNFMVETTLWNGFTYP